MCSEYKITDIPALYIPDFDQQGDHVFKNLLCDLNWVRHDDAPRWEYYANKINVSYTYGRGDGRRTYKAQPWHPDMKEMGRHLTNLLECQFEVCFANAYMDERQHLGWHADDSPEMDDNRPIAVLSYGAEREIWVCPQEDRTDVTRVLLGHGSAFIMLPGMQETHFHRIPKSPRQCGPRVSLTYRGYVASEEA